MANWGGLPSIVSALPNDLRNFLQRVKETLDGAMTGNDRFVTVNDLVNGNVATIDRYGNITSGNLSFDYTPPPAPTNLVAAGALTTIMLQWDDPLYANLAHAEIWRASVDNQGLAVLIGTSSGVLYSDPVDAQSSHYYWVRFISKANLPGAFNAISGVHGTTSADPTDLLAILAASLTSSQLHTTLGTRIDLIDAADTVVGSVAAAQTTANTAVTAAAAVATTASAITARLDTGDFAAVKTESSASASAVTGLHAQYTVKVDAGGYVTGFGLASTVVDGVPYSEFAIRADNFSIAPVNTDNTAADGSPFFYRTTDTVINGVTIPAGAYMKSAYIHDASITNAKIANLAVDNAKIASLSANKITAGSIAVGEYAQSTGYVAGSAGWRIHGDGSAEFANIFARGNIRATSFSAITLQTGEHIKQGSTAYNTGNGFFLGDNGAGTPVFSLKSTTNGMTWDGTSLSINGGGTFSGALSAATGTFAGSLSAATGTFAGALSAATGTFSGALTADAVNAVNTINLAGQAVTIPVSASSNSPMGVGTNLTCVINSTGAPISVSAAVNGSATATTYASGMAFDVKRNGVVIGSANVVMVAVFGTGQNGSGAVIVTDTPGVGTHTYTVVTRNYGTGSGTFLNGGINLMETKR